MLTSHLVPSHSLSFQNRGLLGNHGHQSLFSSSARRKKVQKGGVPCVTFSVGSRICQSRMQQVGQASNSRAYYRKTGISVNDTSKKRVLPSINSQKNGAKASDLVLCFGEMLIDFVPTVNGVSLADAPSFQKAAGGAPANVAVGIARLGGSSAFMGKVGDDEFGHMLANILQKNGVETRGVRFDGGARTALAFVTLRDDGEREFMFYRNPSADMLLEPEELDFELISQAGIVHYGSISLIAEPCRSAHISLMNAAKSSGALLSYDPNLRLPLWSSADEARKEIRSIWEQAHVIKVSEEEITFLTEGGDPYSDEAARALFHDGLLALLVTEGSAGCRYYTKDFQGRVPGVKVDAVDATGAGDAFVAGFLTKLAEDRSQLQDEGRLRETLRFANACGAIATTERGAIPALPNPAKVEDLLSKVHVS